MATALNADTWKYNPDCFKWGKYKPVNWEMLVIHCSATPASKDIGVDWIDYEHRKRGFTAVGYHYVIRRDGTVEKGRPDNIPGAHASGFNLRGLGICMVGGLDAKLKPQDNFTPEQYASLKRLVLALLVKFPHITKVVGHRDLSPDLNHDGIISSTEWMKVCPCFEVKDWLKKEDIILDGL